MFWIILLIVGLLWIIANSYLAGPNLSHFDREVGQQFQSHADDQQATAEFLKTVKSVRDNVKSSRSPKKALAIVREFADNLSAGLETDSQFLAVNANGVPCEWTIAPDADPKRRILFVHGGAFLFGTPHGHRLVTDRLSKIAKAAVLSVDYRLLPKHKRMLASIDCQDAYHWILTQGPHGPTELDKLLVAGDSAGGNLSLMLASWSEVNAARKPDAVLAFSPSTDSTLSSPTFTKHRLSDKMLGESLGNVSRLPAPLRLWGGLLALRCKPNDPLVSPLFGNLSNLPPTLIHASSNEILLGDSIRYTNKANAAGSDVQLQIWENQVHDWHLFTPDTGSGKQAWSEVEKFIKKTLG